MRPLAGALALLLVTSHPSFAQQNSPSSPAQAANPNPGQGAPLAAPAVPVPNTLQNGTAIKLKLMENLTSATAKAGQKVPFEVVEEVDVDGVPVIAKGAQGLGTVTTAESKKTMGRGGKLDVNIDSVRMIDGENAALSATKQEKGGGHTTGMAVGMAATALVFFPAAPFLLFIHGKDITIPEGTEITAFVSGDDKLDMAKFAPGGAGNTATVAGVAGTGAAAGPALSPAMASLAVESSVAGADIEIDGSFVGNTPSTLSVAPGQHTVTVKKKGYADWSRRMTIAGDAVHLNADLVAAK